MVKQKGNTYIYFANFKVGGEKMKIENLATRLRDIIDHAEDRGWNNILSLDYLVEAFIRKYNLPWKIVVWDEYLTEDFLTGMEEDEIRKKSHAVINVQGEIRTYVVDNCINLKQ